MSKASEEPETDVALDQETERITQAMRGAVRAALARHKRLGESVAVWQDGQVVVLSADEIPET